LSHVGAASMVSFVRIVVADPPIMMIITFYAFSKTNRIHCINSVDTIYTVGTI
jgi:hypothetical protein